MSITFITETDRELTAPSEDALEKGWDFYNSPNNTKQDFIEYCASHGIDLLENTDDPYFNDGQKLVDDWADVVAYTYATHGRSK